ncbi:MAG: methyltransferase [Balneolaceae bacterium]|nr:methyltransferase [Balneolaceae bacterium]
MDVATAKTETEQKVTPDKIMKVGFGFQTSKVLLSAVKLGLFTKLAQNPLSGEEIRKLYDLDGRGLYDWLDALVALGFLEREGLKENAVYSNAPDADRFLDQNKKGYLGGILEMANDRLYPFWSDLEEALKTGNPQNEIKHKDTEFFKVLYQDKERLRQMVDAMAGLQMGNFRALINKFDFSQYESLCDIGGADGELCLQVAGAFDHIDCINFDLPKVKQLADEKIARRGMEDRVESVAGDFWEDDFPEADLITMGNILHDWGLDKKKNLLNKAYESLPEDGACIVIENIIDDDRSENVFGLVMSLNMLIETRNGFDFTGRQFEEWCSEIGYSSTEIIPLAGPASAAVAYK